MVIVLLIQVLCWCHSSIIILAVVGVALKLASHLQIPFRMDLFPPLHSRRHIIFAIGAASYKITPRKDVIDRI